MFLFYYWTGVPHADDVYISDYLDVPVLSPEPDVAHLYSSKSGAKRIFAVAGVATPPGELGIYSLQQVISALFSFSWQMLWCGDPAFSCSIMLSTTLVGLLYRAWYWEQKVAGSLSLVPGFSGVFRNLKRGAQWYILDVHFVQILA